MQKIKSSYRAFSLLEAAFAILLVGIFSSALIPYWQTLNAKQNLQRTQLRANYVRKAIEGYVARYGFLPSASPNDQGYEEPGRTRGYIPYKTIGIPKNYIYDGKGNLFSFIVNKYLMLSTYQRKPQLSDDNDDMFTSTDFHRPYAASSMSNPIFLPHVSRFMLPTTAVNTKTVFHKKTSTSTTTFVSDSQIALHVTHGKGDVVIKPLSPEAERIVARNKDIMENTPIILGMHFCRLHDYRKAAIVENSVVQSSIQGPCYMKDYIADEDIDTLHKMNELEITKNEINIIDNVSRIYSFRVVSIYDKKSQIKADEVNLDGQPKELESIKYSGKGRDKDLWMEGMSPTGSLHLTKEELQKIYLTRNYENADAVAWIIISHSHKNNRHTRSNKNLENTTKFSLDGGDLIFYQTRFNLAGQINHPCSSVPQARRHTFVDAIEIHHSNFRPKTYNQSIRLLALEFARYKERNNLFGEKSSLSNTKCNDDLDVFNSRDASALTFFASFLALYKSDPLSFCHKLVE